MLALSPFLPVLLEGLLVFVELALLRDEGLQHRQPLLLVEVRIVISASNCNLHILRHVGLLRVVRLKVGPVLRGLLEVLLVLGTKSTSCSTLGWLQSNFLSR